MTYFAILPNELVMELSLYLNYRDLCLFCVGLNLNICGNPALWLNKIRKELGYDSEFIKEYVYDAEANQMKTLMPLNEKYLELKSRRGADFGCERFTDGEILVERASAMNDFKVASDLTHYLLNVLGRYYNDDPVPTILDQAIMGSISAGNTELADEMIIKFKNELIKELKAPLRNDLITGIYAANPAIRAKLLKHFKISIDPLIDKIDIVKGLTKADNLDELKVILPLSDYKVDANIFFVLLFTAYKYGHKDIIDYYSLPPYLLGAIENGHIELIKYPMVPDVQRRLVEYGYLEIVKEFNPKDIPFDSTELAIYFNHIDMLNYLINTKHDKPMIKTFVTLRLLTSDMFDFLLRIDAINMKIFETLTEKQKKNILRYNLQLYEHLVELGLL